ncbi:MAG: DUF502 domain-containing protein [Pseudobdellovibrionaceae bacterium]
MKAFNKIFFRGLITLLPIAITIYIVYSAVVILENLLGSILRQLLPEYIPGLGLLLTLVLIFLFGLLLNNFITVRLLHSLEDKLVQVPFIKAIYSPLRDLMNLFDRKGGQEMQSVVLVRLGETGAQALGVVTRDSFRDLPFAASMGDKVAVYFPFSYGLGGYTLLVPRHLITEVNLPIEKAMSLAITGWVKADDQGDRR